MREHEAIETLAGLAEKAGQMVRCMRQFGLSPMDIDELQGMLDRLKREEADLRAKEFRRVVFKSPNAMR